MDGSTDAGNKEQELVFLLFCRKDDRAKEIRSNTRYLAVLTPASTTAIGLLDCLDEAMKRLDISIHLKTVGGGTDGASTSNSLQVTGPQSSTTG